MLFLFVIACIFIDKITKTPLSRGCTHNEIKCKIEDLCLFYAVNLAKRQAWYYVSVLQRLLCEALPSRYSDGRQPYCFWKHRLKYCGLLKPVISEILVTL